MHRFYQISVLFFFIYSFASVSAKKNISFLIAEQEYKTEETLPKFAEIFLSKNFSIQFCKAPKEGTQRNHLSNSSVIANADLLFISVRRRAFKEKVMNLIRSHIIKGKPVIGIRTASHAFQLRNEKLPIGHKEWPTWDRDIIGGNYHGHYGKELFCTVQKPTNSMQHPILKRVKLPFITPASLYRNTPLPNTSTALLVGLVKGFPPEPVAWIHRTTFKGKVFYTSLGHEEDFEKAPFQILLKNAVKWCLN
jgi:type 1 glutamine amidotransferase